MKKLIQFTLTLLPLFILSSCLKISHINQPYEVKGGDRVDVPIVVYPNQTSSGVITPYLGVRLPNHWQVITPVTYSGFYTGQVAYSATLSAQENGKESQSGYSWWVGVGQETDTITKTLPITINYKIQTPQQTGIYCLDYKVGTKPVPNPNDPDNWGDDTWEKLPLIVTHDYGAGWLHLPDLRTYAYSATQQITLPVTLLNLGTANADDNFYLSANPPANWAVEFWHEGQSITHTGRLSFKQPFSLELHLTLPANTALGSHKFSLSATSLSYPAAVASTWLDIFRFGDMGITPPNGYNMELLGQMGGGGYTMFIRDSYAYVSEGSALAILDISNPIAPVPLSRLYLSYGIRHIIADNHYAYIDSGNGLCIVDVSNPKFPFQVSLYPTYGPLFKRDHYLYVARDDGLQILDIADPSTPIELKVNHAIKLRNMVIEGNYLYGVDGTFRVFDISDITEPRQVSFLDGFESETQNVALNDSYAYLLNSQGVDVVDISDLNHPIKVGFTEIPGYFDEKLIILGSHLYVVGYDGLATLNISQPTQPVLVNILPFEAYLKDVVSQGPWLYVVGGEIGIRIMDVTAEMAPLQVGHYNAIPIIIGSSMVDKYLYILSEYQGLRIFDVTQPNFPLEVANYPINGRAQSLTVAGHYAYFEAYEKGLEIVDISNPLQPIQVGFYPMSAPIYSLMITNSRAYLATGEAGLRILDLSQPSQPVEIASYQEGESFDKVAVQGDFAYLLPRTQEPRTVIEIVDITNPTQSIQVGRYDMAGSIDNFTIADHYLYAASETSGLHILDISNPYLPVKISSYNIPAYGVKIFGHYAYVVGNVFTMFDITDPYQPQRVGYFDLNAALSTRNIDIKDDFIYAGTYYNGLQILRYIPHPLYPSAFLPVILQQ